VDWATGGEPPQERPAHAIQRIQAAVAAPDEDAGGGDGGCGPNRAPRLETPFHAALSGEQCSSRDAGVSWRPAEHETHVRWLWVRRLSEDASGNDERGGKQRADEADHRGTIFG
jgi:hypothetical protein